MSLRAVCPVRALVLQVRARDVWMYCNEIKKKQQKNKPLKFSNFLHQSKYELL